MNQLSKILDVANKLALEASLKYPDREFRITRSQKLNGGRRSCYIRGKEHGKNITWEVRVSDHPSSFHQNKMFYLDYRDEPSYFVALTYMGR